MRKYPDWLPWILLVSLLGLLFLLGYANYRFSLHSPGGNDFLARWSGAYHWIVKGVNPYSQEVSLATQEMIYGRPANIEAGEDIAHFVYPLPAMIFFAPFGLFPYPMARALWMTFLEIGLPLLAFLSLKIAKWRPPKWLVGFFLIFSIVWYPGARSIIVGQFAVIEAILLAGAVLAVQDKKDILGGILLGLSISKPQMSYLLVTYIFIWSLSAKRWKLLISIIGSIFVLMAGSILLIPNWPLRWIWQVLEYPEYTTHGSPISIITNILPRGGDKVALAISALFTVYLVWEWIQSFGKSEHAFSWTAAMTLVITNLISFRTATTNYVVMLPALTLVFKTIEDRWGKKGRIFTLVILVSLLIGIWLLFLFTIDGNQEHPSVFLPLPILSFVTLLWMRSWVTRQTPLFEEKF